MRNRFPTETPTEKLPETDDGNTIRELIAMRHTVTAVCAPCNHHEILDLDGLMERYGHDMPLRRIALRLRCTKCGARDCGVIVTPQTRPF
ncbi:hypothetical protein [Oricola thermophila]|uniref:Uncharacterized protein n=1 Tax=Oricola thermophila TaxID=2742145 RepID=A0A6N1VHS7_9HYPH|nr:hypothetical protein [Oricola thermophila]QKV18699.1 hypothetical protein HTY61_09685 [Oricola thermophila]